MNKTPDNLIIDEEFSSQLELFLTITAGKLLDHTSADDYLAWAKTSLPVLAPAFFANTPPAEVEKLAYWIGLNTWNHAPQPSNGFKPAPLDKPGRNTTCPCGSGLKYKQCCIHLQQFPDLNGDMMWSLFCAVSSKKTINQILQSDDIPVTGILLMADYYLSQEDFAQVIKILDPLFAAAAPRINHNHSGALDMLCDAYNAHYKTNRKKQDLLQRMSQHSNRSVRAEAWQRLASSRQDAGDIRGARSALSEAMRADPDNPSHCLLELILLVDSNEIELARQRAKFWLHKMRRYQDEYPDIIDILTQAQSDPLKALQKTSGYSNTKLEQLMDWVTNLETQELPSYRISRHMGPEPAKQIELFDDTGDEAQDEEPRPEFDPMKNAGSIEPTEAILSLEQAWYDITPVDKPFSTQPFTIDNQDIWSDENDEWLNFLLKHPQSADSLDILDDVAALILGESDNDYLWGPASQLQPLLERARFIIKKAITDKNIKLPWLITENRPALRLLTHNISMALDNQQQEKAIALMQYYIALNPSDNHGYRSLLVNHYLQQGQNQQALELCSQYPDDMMAEITYGEVLALHRLGNLNKAKTSLLQALESLPLVADYLIKSRVKQPKMDDYGYTYGGEDQAWYYREDMRETWLASAGAMKWLKSAISPKK